jgi:hypothetical protein
MSEELFWEIGHTLTRHPPDGSTSIGHRRFRSLFGTSPNVCSIVWGKIQEVCTEGTPQHLLWALMFLKSYNTEHGNKSITGVDEKTYRLWAWKLVERIADLSVVCENKKDE